MRAWNASTQTQTRNPRLAAGPRARSPALRGADLLPKRNLKPPAWAGPPPSPPRSLSSPSPAPIHLPRLLSSLYRTPTYFALVSPRLSCSILASAYARSIPSCIAKLYSMYSVLYVDTVSDEVERHVRTRWLPCLTGDLQWELLDRESTEQQC